MRHYKWNFWLLCISSYLFFSSFSLILAELPGYLQRLGGEQYLGLIISLFTLTAGLSRPFSGKLTDEWGRVPVMIVGAVVSAVVLLLYPVLTTVAGFLFLRLIHGFSTGFKPTGTSAYAADIVPDNRRGEALGILSMFGTIGLASGPALGSFVYLTYGLNAMFYLSSVFAIASIGILAGMKETLESKRRFTPSMMRIRMEDVFEPSVINPCVIMILTTFSFGTVITLSPDFSGFHGIENRGLFFVYFTGSSLLVRIIGGRLSDRYGRPAVLVASTMILFISMLVIGYSTSVTQFFTGAVVFGIGYGLNAPTLFAWAIDLTSNRSRGRGISTLYIFLEIGIGMGALLSGSMYQGVNDRFPMIFLLAGTFSLAAFVYILVKINQWKRAESY